MAIALIENNRKKQQLILTTNLSDNPKTNATNNKWSHLNQYERKYLKETIKAYDRIMEVTEDVPRIASRYQSSPDDVERAKDYAFGSGVSQNKFSPDSRMAEAWNRMAWGEGTELDEILLRHEILESDLVINRGMSQSEAHELAQQRYPWSILITKQQNP